MSEKRSYEPDPRPEKRIKDPAVMRGLHHRGVICVICGKPASLHHIYPTGQGGDDVESNLIGLCGDGAQGHHGLYHAGDTRTKITLGAFIQEERSDFVFYLQGKLGEEAAREWLRQKFFLSV